MGAVCGWGFGWWRLDRFASGVFRIRGGVFGGDPEPVRGSHYLRGQCCPLPVGNNPVLGSLPSPHALTSVTQSGVPSNPLVPVGGIPIVDLGGPTA